MRIYPAIGFSAAIALLAQTASAEPASSRRGAVRQPAQTGSDYYTPTIKDAAGTPTPILQIPGNVVVVPQQVIQDQQAITVCDALRNVSGVTCR